MLFHAKEVTSSFKILFLNIKIKVYLQKCRTLNVYFQSFSKKRSAVRSFRLYIHIVSSL